MTEKFPTTASILSPYVDDVANDDVVDDGGTPDPARESDGAPLNPFILLGVAPNECRLTVLRTAASETSRGVAEAQLTRPSPMTEGRLAQIVTSTYRVMDPRSRRTRHQRVQLGRILPNALSRAGNAGFELAAHERIEFVAAASPPTTTTAPKPTKPSPQASGKPNRLLAIDSQWNATPSSINARDTAPVASPAAIAIAPNPVQDSEADARPVLENESVTTAIAQRMQTDSAAVIEEFRRIHQDRRGLLAWAYDVRVLAGCTTALFAASASLLIWDQPRDPAPMASQAVTLEPTLTPTSQSPGESITRPLESLPAAGVPTGGTPTASINDPASEIAPVADPAAGSGSSSPANEADSKPPSMPELDFAAREDAKPTQPIVDSAYPATADGSLDAVISAEVAAIEADFLDASATDANPADAKAVDSIRGDSSPAGASPTEMASADVADPIASGPTPLAAGDGMMVDESPTANGLAAMDTAPDDEIDVSLEDAMVAVWEQTESATLRFNQGDAQSLVQDWELMADLSDGVIAAACRSLVRQATWLTDSMETVLTRHQVSAVPWDRPTTQKLVDSWVACRQRVDQTADLNVLLQRANDLLDGCILSHQIEGIDEFVHQATVMTSFTSDEDGRQRWNMLTECLATIPSRAELTVWQAKTTGRGMAGRIMCLKLRRWDEGLEMLTESSDRTLSLAARDEWEVRQLESADERRTELRRIGKRWAHLAFRFDGRDRESIQLHADELQSLSERP